MILNLLMESSGSTRPSILPVRPTSRCSASRFTLVGAEVDSSSRPIAWGDFPVGAPLSQRLVLADASLTVAQRKHPFVSRELVAMLLGSWCSVLEFRRLAYAAISSAFQFSAGEEVYEGVGGWDLAEHPSPRRWAPPARLPRSAAEDLALLAALAPCLETDVTVPHATVLYATDSSQDFGAIVQAEVSESLSKELWLHGEKRGGYTRLDSRARCRMRRLGLLPSGLETQSCDVGPSEQLIPAPKKGFAMAYEVLEVGAAPAGRVAHRLDELGFCCGPLVTPVDSVHLALHEAGLIEWIVWLLFEGRLACLLLSPLAENASETVDQQEWVAVKRALLVLQVVVRAGRSAVMSLPGRADVASVLGLAPSLARNVDVSPPMDVGRVSSEGSRGVRSGTRLICVNALSPETARGAFRDGSRPAGSAKSFEQSAQEFVASLESCTDLCVEGMLGLRALWYYAFSRAQGDAFLSGPTLEPDSSPKECEAGSDLASDPILRNRPDPLCPSQRA